ncbi:hypothetical protein BSKO_05317 [Bryopsis sp. KO-2023]|nr:hypothetical protein BSKO_05317 [Bryopsis sp. KO-2023]
MDNRRSSSRKRAEEIGDVFLAMALVALLLGAMYFWLCVFLAMQPAPPPDVPTYPELARYYARPTCDAPIAAMSDSTETEPEPLPQPEPEKSFRQSCLRYMVDVLIVFIGRFLFRSIFAFATTSPTIINIAIAAVDKSTAATIWICLRIRRLAGLRPI